MKQFEDKELQRRVFLVNLIRITVLSVFLFISIILFFFKLPFNIIPIFIFLLISIFISFFHFYIFERSRIRLSVYIQILSDILIITTIVYFTGGSTSPFYFLYFIPIMISSIFLKKMDTFYSATISYLLYGILADLIYLKIIKPFPGLFYYEMSMESFIYNLIVGFIAFTFFAIVSSLYFDRIKKKDIELKSVQEDLEDLVILNNIVLERMESGFLVCDCNGKVISLNEKAKTLLNIKEDSNIFKLIKIKDENDILNKIKNRENFYSIELKRSKYILEISISSIEEIYSFKRIYVLLIVDLTNKRKIEESLKKKEHLALIGEMSAGIAHEIRNPLASISGSIQFIKNEIKLEKDMQNLMDIVVKESKRLSDSIEEFLQFAKTPPIKRSDFNLAKVIEEVTEFIKSNHKYIIVNKRFNEDVTVNGDLRRIKQVIFNILNNSVKATGENGIIEIDIYKKNEDTFLSIKDNGIGMSKSELTKIFIPFYTKFTSGIGLGMALVKRILDEHDFSINVSSEKKIGTEVTICFQKH